MIDTGVISITNHTIKLGEVGIYVSTSIFSVIHAEVKRRRPGCRAVSKRPAKTVTSLLSWGT